MGGALTRELFRDYVEDRIPALVRADLDIGIQALLRTEQITRFHIVLASLYGEGYTLQELKGLASNADELLITFFSLLSETIQYYDEVIVQLWLNRMQKRALDVEQKWAIRQQIQAYRDKIEEYSRNFEQTDLIQVD